MLRKRVRFGEFEVPIPRGYQQIIDKDDTTDYLFINAPKEIYTVYFDSAMPFYSDKILGDCEEGSTLELKLPDRRIVFFCPSGSGDRKDGLWFFNIDFATGGDEVLTLPGHSTPPRCWVFLRQTCTGITPTCPTTADCTVPICGTVSCLTWIP